MLARTFGPKYTRFPCYVQPKLNGVRALYQDGMFQSRDEKLWKRPVLKHLVDDLQQLNLGPAVLDGELYVHGWRLQRINGAIAVNRNEPCADTLHVEFHIFDIVDPTRKFSQRWLPLAYGLKESTLEHCKVVTTDYVHTPEEMERYFHHYTSKGYEGIMLRPDGPYEFGETPHGTQKRSETLWKYKQWQDDEFMCMGTRPGEGKADIGIGAFLLGTKEGVPLFHRDGKPAAVGTGFSDEERVEFSRNPPIGKLVRVRYLELTADGIPFNPSFLAVMS
jgi:ATP-dependent DNA ligase